METRSETSDSSAAVVAPSAEATERPHVTPPRKAARRWALKMIETGLRELDKSGDLQTDPEVAELCAEVGTYLGRAAPVAPGIPEALLAWMEEVDATHERLEKSTAPGVGVLMKLLAERLERMEANADHLHDDVMAMREWMRIPRPGCYPKHRRDKVRQARARRK